MIKKPRVFIVILNWNGHEVTLECLESISSLEYDNHSIIVVDNGSTDNSQYYIQKEYPHITLLRNDENLGYAEGNNVGIRYALSHGADYIWLLNNDTVVDVNALATLVEFAENTPGSGILGSKIYYYDNPDTIWFAGAKIDWKRAESNHIGQNATDTGQYDDPKEVDRVTGCSMLVRRSVCEEVGLFDSRLFLYAEELDWCVRAHDLGFTIHYVPGSKVYHKVSISTGEHYGTIFSYYNTRNFLYVIKKNFSFPKREFYIIYSIFGKVRGRIREFLSLMKAETWKKKTDISKDTAVLIGIFHFLTGEMGKGFFEDLL